MSGLEYLQWELRPAVLVAPAVSEAFEHEDFSALVWELVQSADLPADRVQIRLGYLYGDAWPPDWTWVTFILDEAAAATIGSVVTAICAWGRNWIKKARQRDPDAKPVKAIIYGPNGDVLREVEVPPEGH